LKKTLHKSAEGLAGSLFELYMPVKDSGFIGGGSSYSSLLEDFPYALNGLVPLAATTRLPRLINLCNTAVQHVLSTQSPDGWLGPDEYPDSSGDSGGFEQQVGMLSVSIWARIPLLQALVQYIEASHDWGAQSAKLQCQTLEAVEAFLMALLKRLNSGRCRLLVWSAARWPDLILTLNWLVRHSWTLGSDCARMSNQTLRGLNSLAWIARVQGFDWHSWFQEADFPTSAINRSKISLYSHGVNNAMAFKWGAVWAEEFGPRDAWASSLNAWQTLQKYHGTPSGAFTADEHLAGKDAHRGTELCVVVESMRSLAEMYASVPSQTWIADSLEKLAFNALPAAVSDDHWAHQYLTQSNAPFAGIERVASLDTPVENDKQAFVGHGEILDNADLDKEAHLSKIFGNVGLDATSYGLAPNFPCCTVNFAQGWPKLLANAAWLWDDGGKSFGLSEVPALLSAVFIPSHITLPSHVGGHVELDTTYPFQLDTPLLYRIHQCDTPFVLLVRIPEWADLTASWVRDTTGAGSWTLASKVADDTKKAEPEPNQRPEFLSLSVTGPSTWEVQFKALWKLWHHSPAGGGFTLGPLVFVLPLAHKTVLMQSFSDEELHAATNHRNLKIRDEELIIEDPIMWSHLIILKGWNNIGSSINLTMLDEFPGAPGDFAFGEDPRACPVQAAVMGIPWSGWHKNIDTKAPFLSLVLPSLPQPSPLYAPAASETSILQNTPRTLKLRPYGCTKLRMAQMPVIVLHHTDASDILASHANL